MKRTHFFALQKQTFFSSKKGKDTEKIIEKYKCVCVCVPKHSPCPELGMLQIESLLLVRDEWSV